MNLFENILKSDESLFLNSIALDFDFQPKVIKYRESQQEHIASCIKPLLQNRNGINILVKGRPGIGKTVCIKKVLNELEEISDEIYLVYVNCWKRDTSFKIANEICQQIGFKFTHNKRQDELIDIITKVVNKKSLVLVLDEADKLDDESIIYSLLEEVYRKAIILITNNEDYLVQLDERVKSRLRPDVIEFFPYKPNEVAGILNQRKEYAFVKGVWEEKVLDSLIDKTVEMEDVRAGLFLMKETGEIAERKSSRKIKQEHANLAVDKLDLFKTKNINTLKDESKAILDLIKENTGNTITELYKVYGQHGGGKSYRTFHRKLKDLEKGNLITLVEENRGNDGRTTLVKYSTVKKLTDY